MKNYLYNVMKIKFIQKIFYAWFVLSLKLLFQLEFHYFQALIKKTNIEKSSVKLPCMT